jgi:hypothetical protein
VADTDSAGVPWKGRAFEHNSSSTDDGSAPPELLEILARFHRARAGAQDVVDVFRMSRLLIPLVAVLGESDSTDDGHLIDKSQELSIVTVAGPDGRSVLPVFSSVAAMSRWNPKARPVPADGTRVAFAAAEEGTELVVLDPTSETEFVIRRPALWAVAQSERWLPCYLDEEVLAAFMRGADGEDAVVAIQLAPGDPDARLLAPELLVQLTLRPGLDAESVNDLVSRLGARWSADDLVAARVDSLAVTLASA